MTKSYEIAVSELKDSRSSLLITSLLPITNALNNNTEIAILLGLLWSIKLLQTIATYKEIGKSKEYRRLDRIYDDIIFTIINNMEKLDLNGLNEKYLYLRYLIENNSLSLPYYELSEDKVKYCKKALEKPLCLNGHAISSSWALFLEDTLRSSSIATATIYGKVIRSGEEIAVKETKNMPVRVVDVKKPTLKERIELFGKTVTYLTAAQERDRLYYLNPLETEVYTSVPNNPGFIVSDKGNVFKIIGTNDKYTAIDESYNVANVPDLLEYKKYILEKIEGRQDLIHQMEIHLEPVLREAEDIYKKLTR